MSSTENTPNEETAPSVPEEAAEETPAPKKALDPDLAKRVFHTDSQLVAKINQLGLVEAKPFTDMHAKACDDTDRLADAKFNEEYVQARAIAEVLAKYAESRTAQTKRVRDEVKSPQSLEREIAQRHKQAAEERIQTGAQRYLEQVSDMAPNPGAGFLVPETLDDFAKYHLSEPGTFKGKLRSFPTQEEANRHVINLVSGVPVTRTEIVSTAASGSGTAGVTFRDLMKLATEDARA